MELFELNDRDFRQRVQCFGVEEVYVYVAVQNTNRCGAISSRQGRTARRSRNSRRG